MAPYNIPGETPEITAKMERCVEEVMKKPLKKFPGRTKKESAIAICKARIMAGTSRRWKARKKKLEGK